MKISNQNIKMSKRLLSAEVEEEEEEEWMYDGWAADNERHQQKNSINNDDDMKVFVIFKNGIANTLKIVCPLVTFFNGHTVFFFPIEDE